MRQRREKKKPHHTAREDTFGWGTFGLAQQEESMITEMDMNMDMDPAMENETWTRTSPFSLPHFTSQKLHSTTIPYHSGNEKQDRGKMGNPAHFAQDDAKMQMQVQIAFFEMENNTRSKKISH